MYYHYCYLIVDDDIQVVKVVVVLKNTVHTR